MINSCLAEGIKPVWHTLSGCFIAKPQRGASPSGLSLYYYKGENKAAAAAVVVVVVVVVLVLVVVIQCRDPSSAAR